MLKLLAALFPALLCTLAWAAPPAGSIAVSANHRYLQHADGTPFFWLADTAWLLFSRLDRAETERYLDDRARKGFNVVQVMLLHSAAMQSAAGVPALLGRNPGQPFTTPGSDPRNPGEYDYWDHVDWVTERAAERGIVVAMVPAWGSLAKSRELNENNVEAYARFLGERYRSRWNIVWLTGGDTPGDQNTNVWKRMGRTLKQFDPGHLVSYHPFGRTQSSTWFHSESWLDFNMIQSGHQRYDQDTGTPTRYGQDNWRYVRDDYARTPVKPVVDGEPSYENIPQGLHDTAQPYWGDADCRRYAYWAVFAGAFGHTYGDNAVMQFHGPGGGKGSYGPKNYWTEALDDPGAGKMQYLKRLMLSRPFFERVPDQTVIEGESGARYDYVAATRGTAYLFAYTFTGRPFSLRLGKISGRRVRAWWYSPRDGSASPIGTFANRGVRRFVPPGEPGDGNDWVLVVDDARRRFASPAP